MKKLLLLLCLSFCIKGYSQADCPAQYVCTGGSFVAQTGLTDELNPANAGCLSSNEATSSYWYQICALTAGTIQFTIAPSGNNNDYDFAVWNGSNCPPSAAPIRCSYAVSAAGPGADNTGVNSTNNAPQTDNSEGVFGNQWVQDINATAGQCFTININNYGVGSDNFDLTFGGTAILNCGPLPIELVNLRCENANNSIWLKWTTLSEINSDKFEVYKSTNGFNFIHVITLDAAGNSINQIEYGFMDSYPLQGWNYYKVKQIDLNGDYTWYECPSACYFDKSIADKVEYFNVLGQSVREDTDGIILIKTTINDKVYWERIIKDQR